METLYFSLFILMTMISPPQPSNVDEWHLVFEDNFNRSKLDRDNWEATLGNGCPNNCGFGNHERQTYTSTPDNLKIAKGQLRLTARRGESKKDPYSSAKITSKPMGGWQYGKISVRAKLPYGVGTWPAIWMMPMVNKYGGWPKSGEIDIMEHVGYDYGTIHGTVHTQAFNHKINTQKSGHVKIANDPQGFHVYSIVWTSNSIIWSIDDKIYFTFTKEKEYDVQQWPFDQPFYLILNLAVGGSWGGQQGIDNNAFPATLAIDWVRVWQKNKAISL